MPFATLIATRILVGLDFYDFLYFFEVQFKMCFCFQNSLGKYSSLLLDKTSNVF